MKILILGGTGFIGTHLTKILISQNHQLTILSRSNKESDNSNIKFVKYDGKSVPNEVGNVDILINLAGAGIGDHRWTNDFKKEIMQSRIDSVNASVQFINNSEIKPKLYINTSAVGFYGTESSKIMIETDPSGKDFLSNVCKKWESETEKTNIRKIILRIGIVLGKDGGAFPKLIQPFKYYAGGHIGSGKQGFPWIHIEDVISIFKFIIENDNIEGIFNVVAPDILDNAKISKKLGKALGTHSSFPIPAFVIKTLLGERSVLLLEGQKVSCDKLLKEGFIFKFPTIDEAIQSLI